MWVHFSMKGKNVKSHVSLSEVIQYTEVIFLMHSYLMLTCVSALCTIAIIFPT